MNEVHIKRTSKTPQKLKKTLQKPEILKKFNKAYIAQKAVLKAPNI
jgi:hypothetical protein